MKHKNNRGYIKGKIKEVKLGYGKCVQTGYKALFYCEIGQE
jgi:hypothetical protein